MSATPFVVGFIPLICLVDKAAYPHFNIYPPFVRPIAPLVKDAPRPEDIRKEPHNEVALDMPIIAPVSVEHPTGDGISRRSYGLTAIAKTREVFEEPLPLPSTPAVSPLRLRRRVSPYALNQLNGRDSSSLLPRVSPAFDSFLTVEARLTQSEDEASEPSDVMSTTLARSQSLPERPPTPKKRQSALIAQKIMALSATVDPPEPDPVFHRPLRRLTRSLPITPTNA